jgi:hypothetical protein
MIFHKDYLEMLKSLSVYNIYVTFFAFSIALVNSQLRKKEYFSVKKRKKTATLFGN